MEDELFGRGPLGRVLCVSERVRQEYLEHYPDSAERLFVVENGVDLKRFQPGLRAAAVEQLDLGDAPRPWLVFAGQDGERKGFDRLSWRAF